MENCCNSVNNALSASDYLGTVRDVLGKIDVVDIERLVGVLAWAQNAGRAIFLFGNGGSAALASHMACDLGKGLSTVTPTRPRVLSLTDNIPLLTAWANDSSYEYVFSEQLQSFVQPGDVAFAISGSGNSPNVLHALRTARKARAVTVGLTGFQGGKMKDLCDACIVVPSNNMQIIEDLHVMAAHAIFTALYARLQQQKAMAAAAAD